MPSKAPRRSAPDVPGISTGNALGIGQSDGSLSRSGCCCVVLDTYALFRALGCCCTVGAQFRELVPCAHYWYNVNVIGAPFGVLA
jgi:hypothetical protein